MSVVIRHVVVTETYGGFYASMPSFPGKSGEGKTFNDAVENLRVEVYPFFAPGMPITEDCPTVRVIKLEFVYDEDSTMAPEYVPAPEVSAPAEVEVPGVAIEEPPVDESDTKPLAPALKMSRRARETA